MNFIIFSCFLIIMFFLTNGGSERVMDVLHMSSYDVYKLSPRRSISDVVDQLSSRIRASQIQSNIPYKFPASWQKDKGVYPSEVKINFVGPPHLSILREEMSVFDNNMFATAWITTCILEARLYANGPKPTDSQLSLALEAIARYQDKNRAYNNSVMNFWPMEYDSSTKMWESAPGNLLKAFQMVDDLPLKALEDLLKVLGLDDVERLLEAIMEEKDDLLRSFHIPPDFDDSLVNLGLGGLLQDLGGEVSGALALWRDTNTNLTSLLPALTRYAYRPFSPDNDVNTIDTRSYYYLRHFLHQALDRGQDIALVPTWVQNIEEARSGYNKGVSMPLQMNNVDVTVSANVVYGLTASVLSGLLPQHIFQDPSIRQIYVNTSSMIACQLEHGLYERPDLELTYYPSVVEFYWFVARTLFRINTAISKGAVPEAVQEVYNILKPALESSMTSSIVEKGKALSPDMVYFDDFLGDGDVDRHNNTLVRGEDRLFTTSVAVNALLSTWTLFDDLSSTTRWAPNTPDKVQSTVRGAVNFLTSYILTDTYKPWNVFFSGSIKTRATMPYFYPANRIEYLNGTVIHDDTNFPDGPFFVGVRGVIPESDYDTLLRQKHFGEFTPKNFTSYNDRGNWMPFWSSSEYTYANAMLALSRFDNIKP